ncbi:MAG: cell envelope integrity protein CreD [Deltaproteobacteria bacterium]|jgi:inner membrane protein|nr:cell envelope integrity protein CreD [Deltaproteobacteria bacterium]
METLLLIFVILLVLAVLVGLVLGIIWLARKINPAFLQKISPSYLRNSPIVGRLICLVIVSVLLLLPLEEIQSLVRTRHYNYKSVEAEIANSWGGPQTILGPMIAVPFTVLIPAETVVEVDEKIPGYENYPTAFNSRKVKKTVIEERETEITAAILPKTLDIAGRLDPEKRSRGIYDVLVYTNTLKITGTFLKSDLKSLGYKIKEINWAKAQVMVGLSDTRAFKGVSFLNLGQDEFLFVPGTGDFPLAPTGFSAETDLSGHREEIPFSFEIQITGYGQFMATPIAEKTTMELISTWPHPSFIGQGLPSERDISDAGFSARWSIPNLVRNYPQIIDLSKITPAEHSDRNERRSYQESSFTSPLDEFQIGVSLVEPVVLYSCLDRATKYAILFISLSFLSFFLFELSSGRTGRRLHLFQYGIIGLALALFYLVVLSLAEHLGFTAAYTIGAAINIFMVGGYVALSVRTRSSAALIAFVLGFMYSILYVILNEEDLALVGGTALLVVALGALMLATKNMSRDREEECDDLDLLKEES